jgi:hypothetical protein
MSLALSFAASVVLLAVLILAAAAFSVYTYRYTVPEITRRRRIVLTTLRALALAMLLFLIFEPILNLRRTRMVPPRVAVLMDDSKSMTIRDGNTERGQAVRALVADRDFLAALDRGDPRPYRFASTTRPIKTLRPDSLRFGGGETDISAALQQAQDDLREENLRAVVLVTDGNVTSGKNPLYTAEALGVPVFVIGVGDSTERKDLVVTSVLANSIAYVESALPIDASIRGSGFGEQAVSVSLMEGGTLVEKKTIQLRGGSNEYPVQFTYTPRTDGVKKMTVEVAPAQGELTVKNNRRTFFVKVLKSKMNVVLVAGAPNPDVSMFDQVLTRDRNVTVTSFIQKLGTSWYGNAPTQQAFLNADCIVLIGYPLQQSGTDVLNMIRTAAEKEAKPLYIVFSREIDLQKLKSALDAWLPFDVVQYRRDETQVFFEVPQDARRSPVISTGIPADAWGKLPPIFKTESSFKARVGAQTLATMKINNIAFNEPLLLTRKINRSKVVAFTGYGLWRWQLAADVLGGRVPDMLLSNAVRWLTTRDDDKRVRIQPVKEFFDSGEPVEFSAQVYNESYEPVDNATVTVSIKGAQGAVELPLTSVGAGRYAGRWEGATEGDYTCTGEATRDGASLGKDDGRFSIGELNVEFQETRMNNVLLRQLAARTGGAYFPVGNAGGLGNAIGAIKDFAPKENIQKSDIQLWNLVWLLGLAVLLFAVEWYLRKQSGMI